MLMKHDDDSRMRKRDKENPCQRIRAGEAAWCAKAPSLCSFRDTEHCFSSCLSSLEDCLWVVTRDPARGLHDEVAKFMIDISRLVVLVVELVRSTAVEVT